MPAYFQGRTKIAIDEKGRIAIPRKHRECLEEYYFSKSSKESYGVMIVTKNLEQTGLYMLPKIIWDDAIDTVLKEGYDNLCRHLISNADEIEIDKAGRILISSELRAATHITSDTKDVMLLGVGYCFEIWEPGLLTKAEEELTKKKLTEKEVKEEFSFIKLIRAIGAKIVSSSSPQLASS